MEHFSYIPFVPDNKTVLRRMGALRAQFSGELENDIETLLKSAKTAFSVSGKAETFPFCCTEGGIEIGGKTVISQKLAKLLAASGSVYMMCATIPAHDVEKINNAIQKGEGLKALVFDAYASECVDGALGVIMGKKNESLRRTGQKLTKHRFSAGYGDLDIKYQKLFYDMLDLSTLNVSLNDKYMLSPEKSVIAVAGVE